MLPVADQASAALGRYSRVPTPNLLLAIHQDGPTRCTTYGLERTTLYRRGHLFIRRYEEGPRLSVKATIGGSIDPDLCWGGYANHRSKEDLLNNTWRSGGRLFAAANLLPDDAGEPFPVDAFQPVSYTLINRMGMLLFYSGTMIVAGQRLMTHCFFL